MHYGDDYKYVPATSVASGTGIEVLPDLFQFTVQIVNVFMVGNLDSKQFTLIDAGTPHSADMIITAVEKRFGKDAKPEAILLTHGHFDHVGGLIELIEKWDVPVYAHELELPFLTGKKSYPKPDLSVEGGLIAKSSPLFPNEPIQLGEHVHLLPEDGTVPYLPQFKWIHTPGHAPGQVAFFREKDRLLIAADTFVTVKQDSLYKVMTQELEINGPPVYLTTDWKAAKQSVEKLAKLEPSIAVTGHGLPLSGDELTEGLNYLVLHFDTVAKPAYGKYVN